MDAYGRYQRMRGKQVFQPIGFDGAVPDASTVARVVVVPDRLVNFVTRP